MQKVHSYWETLRSSLWFVPTLLITGAILLALILIEIDTNIDGTILQERWPRLFGAGAAGSRGMLTAIASSMITVAGVVFSITVVTLSLASSQYTSRILRNFMRDRANQVVLGVFLSIFAYCLIVLRTIRGGDEIVFVPALAVLFAVLMAFVGIGCLIFFIHHAALSIQAESIIASAVDETIEAIDRMFPSKMDEAAGEDFGREPASLASVITWRPIEARRSGYIQEVDKDGLLRFAREQKAILRMERGIGEFVVKGSPLASLSVANQPEEEAGAELNSLFTIGRQRTTVQDAAFGIRQIVDIALRALSPGINDTTTAVTCVDYLSVILSRLADRRIETWYWMQHEELRAVGRGPSYSSLLGEAFDQIRQNSKSNPAALLSLLQAIEVIAGRTRVASRRQALRRQVDLIADIAGSTIPSPQDREAIDVALKRLAQA